MKSQYENQYRVHLLCVCGGGVSSFLSNTDKDFGHIAYEVDNIHLYMAVFDVYAWAYSDNLHVWE